MQRFLKTTFTAAIAVAAFNVSTCLAEPWQGNARVLLGTKTLERDWQSHDSQDTIGFLFDFKPTSWPVALAVDLFGAGNERGAGASTSNAYTGELHLGVRAVCEEGYQRFHPYIGGGFAHANVELENGAGDTFTKVEKHASGVWAGAGLIYKLNEHVTAGMDLRYSSVEIKFADGERNAGGVSAGFTLGYQW